MPRIRVIIVDDDPLARRVVRDALQRDGIIVIAEAPDGRQAVELAIHYRPDVVLMDVVMPGMDGVEATRRICARVPTARVVLLTRSNEEELGILGLQAGAVGFLSKDTPVDGVTRAVRGACRGEASISRQLAMRLVERLQELPESGRGLRPVRSALTPREWEVFDLMCAGFGTSAIAEELVVSTDTIRSHVKHILAKLGVNSREEAVAIASTIRLPRRD